MFQALLALLTILKRWIHAVRGPKPTPDDLDGACPVCDHPFGLSNHMCIGAVTRIGA
jgi:hypothetical protein